jgi:[ribosomal protein S18]-alanine N-acetyltransferase
VTLSLAPMTTTWADEVAAWRYEPPFDLYDGQESTVAVLLDGNHLAILDDGAFIGFVEIGPEARVRGGPTEEPDVTDVGFGLAPDRVSRGFGTRAGALAIEVLRLAGHGSLRASILASNDRSRRLAAGLGFHETAAFEDESGRRFVVVVRAAEG